MKVTFEKNYKNLFTIAEVQTCKAMQEGFKEFENSPDNDELLMLAREALKGTTDCPVSILEKSAVFARNGRAWNAYSDTSERMDVWISGTVRTLDGFLVVGGYLTDVWQIGAVDIRNHVYMERYTKQ